MYNNNDPTQQPSSSKRSSISTQPRLHNGQFARTQPKREMPENRTSSQPNSVPNLSHDHQYQKPTPPANYNGYSPQTQRSMPPHYQQNYNYQQGYSNNNPQMMPQQQGYASPNPNAYHSPQHPGMQSPHALSTNVPPGFQSPTYTNPVGYHSPGHAMMSPPGYAGRQEYHYPNQQDRQQIYANQQQQPQQPAAFQSPPHQAQYQNAQYYQRAGQVPQTPPANQGYNQPGYHNMQEQYGNTNMYQNHTSQYNAMQSPYSRQPAKLETPGYGVANNQPFQIYQSPQTSHNNSYNNNTSMHGNPSEAVANMHARQDSHGNGIKSHETTEQNSSQKINKSKNMAAQKSPTAALRNIRHDQPSTKIGQNSPDIGFSNQYLNFITNRNEPKELANTPKFTNSPNISHKLHKNLYVSSPEQAQIPPSSGMSDSDSKDGMTVAQSNTPIQSAIITHASDKLKDISKRQLDFEHRAELQSEDSRDSVGKESRISRIYSRHSDLQSDGYGMDVDSENSMECAAFKSQHSISLVDTSEISRPADIVFPKNIDPFSRKLLDSLLEYVKFPNKTHADGYNEVRSVPKMQQATVVTVGGNKFSIEKQLGKGNYGAVFLCLDLHSNMSVAVKYQKPSRPWEFYICQEIKARIKDPFMVNILISSFRLDKLHI